MRNEGSANRKGAAYSEIRVAIYPESNAVEWLFPQEKATLNTLRRIIFTLVSL